jgi:hypothetical protein
MVVEDLRRETASGRGAAVDAASTDMGLGSGSYLGVVHVRVSVPLSCMTD